MRITEIDAIAVAHPGRQPKYEVESVNLFDAALPSSMVVVRNSIRFFQTSSLTMRSTKCPGVNRHQASSLANFNQLNFSHRNSAAAIIGFQITGGFAIDQIARFVAPSIASQSIHRRE
jgi:hypothetical protein